MNEGWDLEETRAGITPEDLDEDMIDIELDEGDDPGYVDDDEERDIEPMDITEVLGDRHPTETEDIDEATEESLSYTPPMDPAVVPSNDRQGAEIAAGFAADLEDTDVDAEDLPGQVDNSDLDIQEDVEMALRYHSETADLDDIRVRVRDGVVFLLGTVPTFSDIGLVDSIVSELDGVDEVVNRLDVE